MSEQTLSPELNEKIKEFIVKKCSLTPVASYLLEESLFKAFSDPELMEAYERSKQNGWKKVQDETPEEWGSIWVYGEDGLVDDYTYMGNVTLLKESCTHWQYKTEPLPPKP